MIKISQSRINLWNRCRYAHGLRYIDKLRPKKKNRPLSFGTIIHTMLEAHAAGDDPFEKLAHIDKLEGERFRADPELYGDIINDIRYIMTEYFDYWKAKELTFVRLDKRNAEHKFEVEIAPDILFIGKIDAIVKQKLRKLRWLLEHKTFARKPSVEHRWRNLQSVSYINVIEICGWGGVEGTCWDYIYSKAPTKPEILKNGKLSQNRKITTLPSVIFDVIKTNKLNPREYGSLIEYAQGQRSVYFERVFTPIKPTVVNVIFRDLVATAHDIADNQEKDRRRSIGLHCDWCDYESICRTALNGGDVDFIKDNLFTTQREISYAEEEAERSTS